jgi:2-(1,2-epoxy-1,2-dihydrophenyl)acetyl-CoA isomerase
MTETTVVLDVQDGIARLQLNRPDAGNALNAALGAGLRAAAEEIERRDDVRAVLITAAGRAFCVGGDLAYVSSTDDPAAAVLPLAGDLHAAMLTMRRIDAPVITAVQGAAAGGGLGLIFCADLVIAGASAHFTAAYTAAGLSGDGGITWALPRLVGMRRASELMLTNRRVGADEAAAIGLVTQVVPDEGLEDAALALARSLATGPTAAYGRVKRLLERTWNATFEEQLEQEAEWIAQTAGAPDGREGVAAFLGKRRPEFGGREG